MRILVNTGNEPRSRNGLVFFKIVKKIVKLCYNIYILYLSRLSWPFLLFPFSRMWLFPSTESWSGSRVQLGSLNIAWGSNLLKWSSAPRNCDRAPETRHRLRKRYRVAPAILLVYLLAKHGKERPPAPFINHCEFTQPIYIHTESIRILKCSIPPFRETVSNDYCRLKFHFFIIRQFMLLAV